MEKQQTEHTPPKRFRYGSEDPLIAKYLKPPSDNMKQLNQCRFSQRVNRASQKECKKGDNDYDQNIYAYMALMSGNDESTSREFGDSLQLTNWILDSGATCHMIPKVSDHLLEDRDKYIEVADGHHVHGKAKSTCSNKMCDNNGDTFIAPLRNVLLVPYLCNRLFSIIALMNSVRTCLFHEGFCTVYFGDKEKMRLLYHIVHSRNMHFGGK